MNSDNSQSISNDFYNIISEYSILYVEDEALTRLMIKTGLCNFFKDVHIARNGKIGLEVFKENKIDIILTDVMMPEMNGIEMLRQIRKTDPTIPIVVTTAFDDQGLLIDAINLGVRQFVPKPVQISKLYSHLKEALQSKINEQLKREAQDQELEVLKYKERYHAVEQKNAFKKELNIIQNDVYLKSTGSSIPWRFSLFYEPKDILSGDSYSIRRISENKYFGFVLDHMGKGLSASVTTVISTSYLNHLVDSAILCKNFSLKKIIEDYASYIQKVLLDEEIVCGSFVFFDFIKNEMSAALYSMPPILIKYKDGELDRIVSNNPPISKYMCNNHLQTIPISNIERILIATDGILESQMEKGDLYFEQIEDDFIASPISSVFLEKIKKAIPNFEDDATFFFIRQVYNKPQYNKTFTIKTSSVDIGEKLNQVEEYLTSIDLKTSVTNELMTVFYEMVMNAYEHGNLNIGHIQKHQLITDQQYDNYLKIKEVKCDKKIYINIESYEINNMRFITCSVEDEGNGFNTLEMKKNITNYSLFNGRGIQMSKMYIDEIYYNPQGNIVRFIKKI